MKTILALAYFFGSILIIFGLLWLGLFLAPPEFVLGREVVAVEHGALKNLERLFPNLRFKEPFHYPGALAGLAGEHDDCKVRITVGIKGYSILNNKDSRKKTNSFFKITSIST